MPNHGHVTGIVELCETLALLTRSVKPTAMDPAFPLLCSPVAKYPKLLFTCEPMFDSEHFAATIPPSKVTKPAASTLQTFVDVLTKIHELGEPALKLAAMCAVCSGAVVEHADALNCAGVIW